MSHWHKVFFWHTVTQNPHWNPRHTHTNSNTLECIVRVYLHSACDIVCTQDMWSCVVNISPKCTSVCTTAPCNRCCRERGGQIWVQSGSDWPQMGHIRDFFISDFSTFWRGAPKCTEIWYEKNLGFVSFWGQFDLFWWQIDIPTPDPCDVQFPADYVFSWYVASTRTGATRAGEMSN